MERLNQQYSSSSLSLHVRVLLHRRKQNSFPLPLPYQVPQQGKFATFAVQRREQHKYYLYISKFITTKQYLLFNIEEITVKGFFSFVKKIVSSTRTVFELIGDIKYSSDREIKEGTNFIIEINKIENLAKNVVASVKIIQIAEMKNTVRFKCFVKDITKSLPNRIVTFDIYKNDNHNITIIYIHKFDRPVEGRTLQVFRTIKKFLLDQLAMIIETNYYKQDYNAFYKE